MAEHSTNQRLADALGGILILGALPGSPAAELGFRYGDIVLSVNGQRTGSVEDFLQARALETNVMRVELVRGGQSIRYSLDISQRTGRRGLKRVVAELEKKAPPASDRGPKSGTSN